MNYLDFNSLFIYITIIFSDINMTKIIEERIDRIEVMILKFGKILEDQSEILELLSEENEILNELIDLKSSNEIKKKREKETYFT